MPKPTITKAANTSSPFATWQGEHAGIRHRCYRFRIEETRRRHCRPFDVPDIAARSAFFAPSLGKSLRAVAAD
jgi:hypothetical protein